MNAWYAISLLGKVVGRDDVRDLGMALLATEIKSAQTYWHTSKGSDIYPADFARGAAVGMLWSSLAQQQTWFGVAPYYIHGIQMLPFTPASEVISPHIFPYLPASHARLRGAPRGPSPSPSP